jgi:microcystin-dependent protein
MALPVRKGYKGAPAKAVLTSTATDSDLSFVVDTVSGWATTFPYYCVVEPGTSKEEKVKVTAISGVTLTVVRAQDDTSAQGHNDSAAIYPVFTADEADEANEIASVMTTKGDLIATNGSAINRLGVGTNTHVLQADSTATNGFKWGQIVEAGIADSAVTSAKIANSTIVLGDLAAALQAFLVPVGTINAYPGATAPTGWLLCNGTSTSGYTALAALVGATTPDLQGHTLVGKGSAPFDGALLSKFGSTTSTAPHTHDLGSHTHGAGTLGATSDGSHDHTYSGNVNAETQDHSHGQLVAGFSLSAGGVSVIGTGPGGGVDATYSTGAENTTHNHSFSGTTSPHTSHTHPVTGNTGGPSAGSGASSAAATHGNVQPSALVNFIIKHD